MPGLIAATALKVGRVVSLIVLAAIGTILLMRVGPGYFSDEREMDAQYSAVARADIDQRQAQEGSVRSSVMQALCGWARGDLGRSRQYDVPVADLLKERVHASCKLLAFGVFAGWSLAGVMALMLGARRTRRGEALIAGSTALLLSLPLGAVATICMLTNLGGPILVLALLIAVRDFKLLYRILHHALRGQQILYARAQGFSLLHILRTHLFSGFRSELVSLSVISFIVALSAIVPVEVIFDTPGLGQLAWSAAMNRDLPVLIAVTLLMSACVGVAGLAVSSRPETGALQCA